MTIRVAEEADAQELLDIYAPYIDTPITFESEVPSLDEFMARIREIRADYPYLVYEEDGCICGYAYAHRFHERAAYRWGAELSVYVDGAHQSRGVGRALYGALIDILRLQNVHTVYGCVTVPNEKSQRMHEAFGFRVVGVFRNAGFKGGIWHDVAWYEKAIGDFEVPPEEFVSFDDLHEAQVEAVLARA